MKIQRFFILWVLAFTCSANGAVTLMQQIFYKAGPGKVFVSIQESGEGKVFLFVKKLDKNGDGEINMENRSGNSSLYCKATAQRSFCFAVFTADGNQVNIRFPRGIFVANQGLNNFEGLEVDVDSEESFFALLNLEGMEGGGNFRLKVGNGRFIAIGRKRP